MVLFSYVMVRDYGFAPNPFENVCTLATCKPQIRKYAQIGDWVAGFGGAGTNVSGKLIYLMRVDEAITFDAYWKDRRFVRKKACFKHKYQQCYGDNIYHHVAEEWVQENSHHSYENAVNRINLEHDTKIDRVLISYNYWYFGDCALEVPEEFSNIMARGRGYKKIKGKDCEDFVDWLSHKYEMCQQGFPSDWPKDKSFIRFKGERN